jgi:RNA polymerase sigma factor (sigma-70 family)
VVEKLSEHDPSRGSFPSWLVTVILNALNAQDRRGHELGQLADEAARRQRSREADPAEACELSDKQMTTKAALEEFRPGLSEKTYRIVQSHWLDGKSYADIAAAMGLTARQVRDRDRRAMVHVRAKLERLR